MAIKKYTYGELLSEIKEEFGFDGSSKDAFVGTRLNRAMQMIKRKRPTWHYMARPLVINVQAKVTGTADFTNGSSQLTNVVYSTANETDIRHVLYDGEWSGNLTKGSMVVDKGAGTLTLDSTYIGVTEVGKAFTSTVAYFELPDDFSKMQSVYNVKDPRRRFQHTHYPIFERYRVLETPVGGITPIYTVVPDPLPSHKAIQGSSKEAKQFLVTFPYLTDMTTLRALYFFTFQDLDSSSDISFLPQEARSIIISATAWFIALAIGDSRMDEYKQQTVAAIEELASDDSFVSDDSDRVVPGMFLESDGVDGPDGPGQMPSFNDCDDFDGWGW